MPEEVSGSLSEYLFIFHRRGQRFRHSCFRHSQTSSPASSSCGSGITGPAKLTAGWAFILWGLHKADYPLLRPLAWAAPLGYILGAVFGFISAVSIILVYLEKTRKELKASEEKYRSIFENAVEGIFQTTPEGRFLSANPSLARMYGYESPEQLLGPW